MKIRGGYNPKIPGRPSSAVREIPVPGQLHLDLHGHGLTFIPAVKNGETVAFGTPLAWAEAAGGKVALPAPAAGTTALQRGRIVLTVTHGEVKPVRPRHVPGQTNAEAMRTAFADTGIWPLIWSSKTKGMPRLDGTDVPDRILVNFVAAEPFRTRGKVILQEREKSVAAGLRFLPQLLAKGGSIHLFLTALSHPVAQAVRKTGAQAPFLVESAPVRYPVEQPRVLIRAFRKSRPPVQPPENLWVIDAQTLAAMGACLGEGIPLHDRIVALGGPGAAQPSHVRVRIGTRLDQVLAPGDGAETKRVLRGGLFRGNPVNPANTSIGFEDDALFVIPRPGEREFMAFAMPGFDRVSLLPCFASRLTGAADRSLTTSLRGERRPCIACGLCEDICPMGLMPQVLHRYLYRDSLDDAAETGLGLCTGCGLCSFVCPSKIELRHQFAEALERLRLEREHLEADQAKSLNATTGSVTPHSEAGRK